ncbi:hypothetical protein M9Y10_034702 [Tritrichomonas musculus]|uniref:Peptidase S74 domain-containing protein n=1 Tax=Tritrichomonas musculus TaxID=1915356 RepID=A0ABR2HEA9_9EUKA
MSDTYSKTESDAKFALKSDIRAYNDLSYCSTNKTTLTVGKMAYNGAPKILPFHDGAHIKFNASFADYTEAFDFIFRTTSITEDVHTMIYTLHGHEYNITWEDNHFGEFNVKLNNVTKPISYSNMIADIGEQHDTIALNSQITELRNYISMLEARVASLENGLFTTQ